MKITTIVGILHGLRNKKILVLRILKFTACLIFCKIQTSCFHQMESERFSRFVQEAWVNQRQWKADEKERRAEEEKKKEKEAQEIRQRMEEEERKLQEERLSKQAEWKVQLEAQIEQIK